MGLQKNKNMPGHQDSLRLKSTYTKIITKRSTLLAWGLFCTSCCMGTYPSNLTMWNRSKSWPFPAQFLYRIITGAMFRNKPKTWSTRYSPCRMKESAQTRFWNTLGLKISKVLKSTKELIRKEFVFWIEPRLFSLIFNTKISILSLSYDLLVLLDQNNFWSYLHSV